MLEEVGHRAVGADIAAVLGEGVAHFRHGARAVVGEAIDHHRRAAGAVALVAHLLVGHAVELAAAALDRVLHAVLRHVGFARLVHREAQPRVDVRIAAAELRGHRDLLDQPREHLAFLGVRRRLAVLDVRPLAVACHAIILRMLLARNEKTALSLLPALANRHGLITGATGTGKTLTMQAIAQRLSALGVPVFMADVKGDFSGIAQARAAANAKVVERLRLTEDQARVRRLPGRVLGPLRQERPAGARHRLRHGPAAPRPHARPERDPGRRARPGVQDRRRPGPADPRSQGPARDAAARRRQRGEVQDRSTAM